MPRRNSLDFSSAPALFSSSPPTPPPPPPDPAAVAAATHILRHHSMATHDSFAIPSFPLRRPRLPPRMRATVQDLVADHPTPTSTSDLITLATSTPPTIPYLVRALRTRLVRRSRPGAIRLIHDLVLRVPFFYRYIATPSFLRALTRRTDPSAVRILLAGWARDLHVHHLAHDPAATFWVTEADRLARRGSLPNPPPRRFVFAIVDAPCITPVSKSPPDSRDNLPLSQRLLDCLADYAATPPASPSCDSLTALPRPLSSTHTQQRPTPPHSPPRTPPPPRFNARFLAVLRRHDYAFGTGDPYYIAPPTTTRVPRNRCLTRHTRLPHIQSPAAIARENARRKLREAAAMRAKVVTTPGPPVEEQRRDIAPARNDRTVRDIVEGPIALTTGVDNSLPPLQSAASEITAPSAEIDAFTLYDNPHDAPDGRIGWESIISQHPLPQPQPPPPEPEYLQAMMTSGEYGTSTAPLTPSSFAAMDIILAPRPGSREREREREWEWVDSDAMILVPRDAALFVPPHNVRQSPPLDGKSLLTPVATPPLFIPPLMAPSLLSGQLSALRFTSGPASSKGDTVALSTTDVCSSSGFSSSEATSPTMTPSSMTPPPQAAMLWAGAH